ncbi:MAG TPA: MgtC/SapB family protein [Thermomicrobiales bacterium]|nr:MgtC/SapB family protein [Thermomicrobiales bacterium]
MFDPSTTELALRVMAALLCGGAIGLDRELRSHSAGMRTHALAAEGAALFTIAGILISGEAHKIGYEGADPTRIASTVAQGIGFLAAGVIFGSAARIKGLTTAAGLWTTAAVGMLCGGGFFEVAAIATVATVVVLSAFKVIENKLDRFALNEEPDESDPSEAA